MSTCTVCGKELPTGLDEFGERDTPVCRDHWFSDEFAGGLMYDPDTEEKAARAMLEDIEDEKAVLHTDMVLATCEHERQAIQQEMLEAERKREAANYSIRVAQRTRELRKQEERNRVTAWINGEPIRG